MAGVIWRQHRFALAAVAVLLGALAVYEWLTGESLHHAWAAAIACHPAGSPAAKARSTRSITWRTSCRSGGPLQLVPALIGAFAGAPVLAREMETGTFRFAWTQGFGRWRWALAKLAALAVVLAAAAARSACWCPGITSRTSPRQSGPGSLRALPFVTAVQPARAGVPRLDAGRLRDRRPGRHAHPPGRPRDRRHPGRLHRAHLRSQA